MVRFVVNSMPEKIRTIGKIMRFFKPQFLQHMMRMGTLSHSLTHTLSLSLLHTLALYHTHTRSLSHTHTPPLSHTHTLVNSMPEKIRTIQKIMRFFKPQFQQHMMRMGYLPYPTLPNPTLTPP